MKRYRPYLRILNKQDSTHAVVDVQETIPLEWSYFKCSDLQAWALRHKATVEGMEHPESCDALYCTHVFANEEVCLQIARAHENKMAHAFIPGPCGCRIGDALREIEELLK